ncbi:cupin domain-containing protein [Amnibacterium sp. CER49]|uniref:cupin domain-containing protein n=1 Tax=Amnibacterium sp. CER49 TaxID=3039161 RepID=UPI0024492894|nr:cupin domain-containing protein [Amnibacterium sp. CER49]MDH2445376.1 cupin domain-containing protein [Amnibacterium sp. CER49]
MPSVLPEPSQQRLAIGAKLRATRHAQGMTIAHVAEATGLTKGFISRVERDETSPSVVTLIMLCEVLSLPVGRLFEAPERAVVRLADAPRINLGGVGVVERLVSARSEPRVQVIRSTLEPGASGGPDLYTMSSEAEVVHVLSGAVRLRFATEEVALTAGDSLTFAGRDPHSWTNVAEGRTELVWVLAPAAWSGSG